MKKRLISLAAIGVGVSAAAHLMQGRSKSSKRKLKRMVKHWKRELF